MMRMIFVYKNKLLTISAFLFFLTFPYPTFALTESWVKIYTTNNMATPYSASLDPTGNYIYVGGRTYDNAVVVKYDTSNGATSTGWPVSFRHSSTSGGGYMNNAGSITIDTSGNVYVSGDFWQGESLGIIKYAPSGGSPLWTKLNQKRSGQGTFGATDSKNAINPFQTVLYVMGADLIGNNFVNRYATGDGSFVSEYLDSGTSYSTPPSSFRVTTDSQGNIYSLSGTPNSVLRRRNSAGSVIWTRSVGTTGGRGLVIDPGGNYIYLSVNNLVTKLASSTGNVVAPWPIYPTHYDSQGLTVTPNNRLYVFGRTNCSGVPIVCYLGIGVYNASDGSLIENYVSGRQIITSYTGTSDASNNVYAVGGTPTGPSSAGYLIIKYGSTCTGPFSFTWTNTISTSSRVNPIDFNELRTAIETLRSNAGLAAYSWTNPPVSTGGSIKASYLNDLRASLEQVYTQCGQGLPTWTDGSRVSALNTRIKAQHITELRAAVSAAK